jgi:hypothetical protein
VALFADAGVAAIEPVTTSSDENGVVRAYRLR